MSLKAKLEAVIYASEEPVTLTQLASLFAADALEWKAAQATAAAEQTAELAGESPSSAEPLPLLAEGLEYLGMADMPAVYPGSEGHAASDDGTVESVESTAGSAESVTSDGASVAGDVAPPAEEPGEEADAQAAVPDAEAEARRTARQRDREVKAVLRQLLDQLIAGYAIDGRGVEIREIAGGYRMATKPECHDAVRLFVKSLKPPLKLSLPALETLAVVAYKQPVTAPEVNEIRGVESAGVLGSLLARKLIATAGRKQVIGRPILYKTTREFLLRFGLKDVAELPSMEEFEKMAAIELEEPETNESGETAALRDPEDNSGENGFRESGPSEDGVAEEGPEEGGEIDLESNSPSGLELAGATTEATEFAASRAREDAEAPASDQTTESVADLTAVMAAEPRAASAEPPHPEAAPAEPDPTLQAETEAFPHAEEDHEEDENER